MFANLTLIQKIIIWVFPVLFAVTVHEVAHGWMAYKLGDKTAYILCRLSLNPIKHIDPIGTIVVPGILLFLGGFIFGWAKPVPVNYNNLRNLRRDVILVSVAGPASNFIMALIWGFIGRVAVFLLHHGFGFSVAIVLMAQAGIIINIVLMVLNLIPIPPLDGSKIVEMLLPKKISSVYESIAPYGFFILLALIMTGVLSAIMTPFISIMFRFVAFIVGFS